MKSVDDAAAKKVPGFIKAVTLDDKTGSTSGWVVAVANTYANARKAADALKITYDIDSWTACTTRAPARSSPGSPGSARPRA